MWKEVFLSAILSARTWTSTHTSKKTVKRGAPASIHLSLCSLCQEQASSTARYYVRVFDMLQNELQGLTVREWICYTIGAQKHSEIKVKKKI